MKRMDVITQTMKFLFMTICMIQIMVCSGCATFTAKSSNLEKNSAEKIREVYGDPPAKGYQPLDPMPVEVEVKNGDKKNKIVNYNKALLNALPNEAVRLAIGKADSLGNISFGPFTAMTKTGSYVVVLDYIKYDSKFISVYVTELIPENIESIRDQPIISTDGEITDSKKKEMQKMNEIYYEEALNNYLYYTPYWARSYSLDFSQNSNLPADRKRLLYNIPVYEGIGVRMVASITVSDTSVDIGSLFGLAAAAQNKQLQGSLTIQTLGLSGENISSQIPLPSEINVTTIQNAIQALATIKSKIYDANVLIVPVILAIDDYVGRNGAKEAIITGLRVNGTGEKLKLFVNPIIN